ncbi:hypothetical protein SAMN04488503_0231 [Humidesulfovibrio mexicanus]|uniref:Uncharacterized protein n=1 Tax=Humidesulfovibrio mexicanus TaxID=147047 RepID=A0A238XLM6_9BACT|nr:hypothetical protein [Humidesulfovibrio mexicanus]SNR59488.1 hypothetical protein SAMN04488503_0231 [Humidesulfovibrio mexicanus]
MFIEKNSAGRVSVVDTLTSVSSVLTYLQQTAEHDLSGKGKEGLALILMSAVDAVDASLAALEGERGTSGAEAPEDLPGLRTALRAPAPAQGQ